MNAEILHLQECFHQALILSGIFSALVLIPTFCCAVFVGFFQALTSVQEQILSFVPKILVGGLILYFVSPWMHQALFSFEEQILDIAVRFG